LEEDFDGDTKLNH